MPTGSVTRQAEARPLQKQRQVILALALCQGPMCPSAAHNTAQHSTAQLTPALHSTVRTWPRSPSSKDSLQGLAPSPPAPGAWAPKACAAPFPHTTCAHSIPALNCYGMGGWADSCPHTICAQCSCLQTAHCKTRLQHKSLGSTFFPHTHTTLRSVHGLKQFYASCSTATKLSQYTSNTPPERAASAALSSTPHTTAHIPASMRGCSPDCP